MRVELFLAMKNSSDLKKGWSHDGIALVVVQLSLSPATAAFSISV